MKNIKARLRTLETKRAGDAMPVLIAVSPGETNDEAMNRSGNDKASLQGRTVYFVHTGVPRQDPYRVIELSGEVKG